MSSRVGREDDLKRILVICTGNRARSQMAEGWLRHLGKDTLEVRSAGTEPKGIHPLAIEAMAEVGIDITRQTSEHVATYGDQDFDLVVTVCDDAREACPVFPGARRVLHRAFEDPDYPEMSRGELLDVFCRIRDEVGTWAGELLGRGDPGPRDPQSNR